MAGPYGKNKGQGLDTQEKGSNKNAASASPIGEPFHNPYTFIPFPDNVERYLPTALTVDEHPDERHRQSGVLDLEIKTLSPLMTCSPVPVSEKEGHKTFKSLTIGNDVIVPATSVRGALRTLMTIISGGTLGYMDEDLWLTQGRDAQLGPSSMISDVPDNAFLAEIVRPGSGISPGIIQLGETKLIKADDLKQSIPNMDNERRTAGKNPLFYTDSKGEVWKVKLSGRPIKYKGKKEGLFKGNGDVLELSEEFWKTYQGRHRHSVKPELKKGDLIWLEPTQTDCKKITCEADIKSIQWARWGRHGVAFKELILSTKVLPDSMRNDGGVDMVTDLFGQIPKKGVPAAGPFAARIRPGNLIFFDAKDKVITETLAPLAAPHPGCIAFYRDQEDLDIINKESPLKGYKVYRNTKERGDNAPWKYSVQGVYVEKGALKTPTQQKINKTAELLNEGLTGRLRISFRALTARELALLYAACSVDWKLGGGKPLGLGHCRVTSVKKMDEDGNISTPMGTSANGENLRLAQNDLKRIAHLEKRIALYRASQIPVNKLRYPRAVTKNENKSSRAGLSWFARHASPKKNGTGLETIWTTGDLQKKVNGSQIKAQALPKLNVDDQTSDLLYGYDAVELDVDESKRNQRLVGRMEKFDAAIRASSDEKAGENISQNRETRKSNRAER
ncbi:MAG: hypothetical protein WC836_20545 [Desulfobacula sp.]|jgi:hypothetical protein